MVWYIMLFDECILCLGNLFEVGLGFPWFLELGFWDVSISLCNDRIDSNKLWYLVWVLPTSKFEFLRL